MAPGYRANNHSRRANRSYIDHDVFEGLPVRNWRRDTVTVAPPEVHDLSTQKDKWDVELPYGMPKDSHLLPQHSQDLLRAARSGKLYLKRTLPEEEEIDVEAILGEKPEKKEDPKGRGFTVKAWKPVPRHLEGPEIDYLAKRRKGLNSPVVKPGTTPGATLTKTKVRRTDAAGNTYVEDVLVPEGQPVEGEVISQTVINHSATAGVVTEGQNAQPVPPRRRPPPPKRKAKGSGRGRKRKLPLPPTSVPSELTTVKTEGQAQKPGVQGAAAGPDGIKLESSTPIANDNDNDNEDTEMGDGSIIPSDEEGDDGEEGASDEDDDQEGEGENDREGDDQDDELEPATSDIPGSNHDRDEIGPRLGQQRGHDVAPPPPVPLAAPTMHQHGFSGSPLKKVVTPPQYSASFENSNLGLSGDEEAEGDLDEDVDGGVQDEMGHGMHDERTKHSYQMAHDLSLENAGSVVSFNVAESEVGPDGQMMALHHHLGELAGDEEMLLDGDGDGGVLGSLSFPTGMVGAEGNETSIHSPHGFAGSGSCEMESAAAQDDLLDTVGGADGEDDDGFEDLLGSLEDHLNDQAAEAAQNETPMFGHDAAALGITPEAADGPVPTAATDEQLAEGPGPAMAGMVEASIADVSTTDGAGGESTGATQEN